MTEYLDLSTAHPEVLLLVGTRTGNAELVADAVAEALRPYGFLVDVVLMMDVEPELLYDYAQVIVCTSTYGEGEPPEMAQDFYEALAQGGADLSHLAYGIISLGDRHYEHFAQGGRLFEALLDRLGAVAVIDLHEIDQGPRPEQLRAAQAWALDCVLAFAEAFAPAEEEVAAY